MEIVPGITPIGVTNFRSTNQRFGIKDQDRLGHMYIVGKTGVGKSTLIKNMVISDLHRNNGLCLIDPHGDLVSDVLKAIPARRRSELIYINPKDQSDVQSFNPIYRVNPKYHHLVASGLVSTFRKVWSDSWGVRLEYLLRYCLLTLLWCPDPTLLDIRQLLTDREFREAALENVSEPHIIGFWRNEFERYSPRLRAEAISPILNKMGVLVASPPLRQLLGQRQKGIRLQPLLDQRKILLVNLSKGEIGEDAASLLGCILVSSIQLAAIHRSSQPEEKRQPFYLYIDECQLFMTAAISEVFSEARKYKLSLCMANQYIGQLQEPIRNAIFGNVGTIICFRVGADDAAFLCKEFYPVFDEKDLINLPRYSVYIKLMIDGATSIPFSATTVPSASEVTPPPIQVNRLRKKREFPCSKPPDTTNIKAVRLLRHPCTHRRGCLKSLFLLRGN